MFSAFLIAVDILKGVLKKKCCGNLSASEKAQPQNGAGSLKCRKIVGLAWHDMTSSSAAHWHFMFVFVL